MTVLSMELFLKSVAQNVSWSRDSMLSLHSFRGYAFYRLLLYFLFVFSFIEHQTELSCPLSFSQKLRRQFFLVPISKPVYKTSSLLNLQKKNFNLITFFFLG